MRRHCRQSRALFLLLASSFLAAVPALAADWPPIAPEDLKMTDFPRLKGAPAVILLREEVTDDPKNFHSVYKRIKVLTEAGRRYADVELEYAHRQFTIDSISGRTVHPDGTVVPFDGKVFNKTAFHGKSGHEDIRYNVKAFTLPDVQVGSIIEYRYSIRYDDHSFWPPDWEVQADLFQRSVTFKFMPYDGEVIIPPHMRIGHGAAWSSLLPTNGPRPKLHQLPMGNINTRHNASEYVDLTMTDIPPIVKEPFMPPEGMLRYRVRFYYTVDPKPEAYWKEEGKFWSKDVEKFLDRKDGVEAAVDKIVLRTDTPDQKVRKIYDYATTLENQSYRPQRSEQETKGLGLKANEGAEDVLRQHSGDHDDLNRLFVAMARAAEIPASMMWVASREETFFSPELMSTQQMEAEVAIVQLGGKDVFLDPGTKFCPYGLLDWRYSGTKGLRENSRKETEFAETPLPDYNQAQIQRLARLQLSDDGRAQGAIKVGFYGQEAMDRRQKANATDDAGRKELLENEMKKWLPSGSDVTLNGTPNWGETEVHLAAEFKVSVPLASATGKRWVVPVHIFQVNEKPVFPSADRVNAIYLWYRTRQTDEVHIALPSGFAVESLPANDSVKLDYALYSTSQKQESPNSIVARRDEVMGGIAFPVSEYKQLKDFYDKAKTADDQPMILKVNVQAEAQ